MEKKLDSLQKKGDKLEEFGVDKQSKQWKSLKYDVAQTEIALEDTKEKLTQMMGINIDDVSSGYVDLNREAKKCIKSMDTGTKKSIGMMERLGKRTKAIMTRMLISRAIYGIFSSIGKAISEGSQKLAQYSSSYNKSMSEMKSGAETLKNSIAAAFEPIVTAAVPYLTILINWLNTAANAIAKFLAALSGRKTYIKAKKQVVDYAKSLNEASEAAKGSLAAFDEINVLDNGNGGGKSSGGGASGAGAFEEEAIDDEFLEKVEKFKEIMEELIPLAVTLGGLLLAWKIGTALADLIAMHPIIGTILGYVTLLAGAALAAWNYLKMWCVGVEWDSLLTYIAGVAMVAGAMYALFGPMAAGLALIVISAAGLVLALKDIWKFGLNAKNSTLLLFSALGLVVGVFMAFGGTAALFVAAGLLIVGAIAGMIVWTGNGEEALGYLKDALHNLGEFVKNVFAGNWEKAWENIKKITIDIINLILAAIESLVNGIIKGINKGIDALNKLHFSVPDWVPGIGGKSFGLNIPNIPGNLKLPRLAEGAVIRGGAPFTAILGDQPRGQTNIEAPIDTIRQAVAEVIAASGGYHDERPIYLQLDGKTVGRLMMPYLDKESNRIGVSLLMN